MHTLHEVRPWRLGALFISVLLVTAYLPHPHLGEPLPQSLNALVKSWVGTQPEPEVTIVSSDPRG